METPEVTPGAPRIGRRRWIIVFLLLVGGMVNFIDRTSLSVAAPEMMRELHLTNADIGLLGTVFSLIYALFQLPSGWLIDKLGAKKVYAFAIFLWSGATMLTGGCWSRMTLVLARGVLGVTEAPCWPSAAKITAAWFPKKERGMATGVWDAASKWGPAVAPPLLVYLMVSFGWRPLFYIAGGFGILFSLFLIAFYQQPEKAKWLSKEELSYIKQGGGGTAEEIGTTPDAIRWRDLFAYRSVWGMILGWFCYIWMFNILTYFVPLYLLKTQDISISSVGFLASVPSFGGIIGAFVGGYVSKWLVDNRSMEPMVAKRATIAVCAVLGGLALVATPFFPGLGGTLVMLTIGTTMLAGLSANGWALPGDVAPPSMVGSVGGIQNFGGYFAGSLSPLATGLIVDATGSYALAFISGGVIAACSALCYWFIVNKAIEPRV